MMTPARHADALDGHLIDALAARETRLLDWFRQRGSALIGFSGGVDSAYLACVAIEGLDATEDARHLLPTLECR